MLSVTCGILLREHCLEAHRMRPFRQYLNIAIHPPDFFGALDLEHTSPTPSFSSAPQSMGPRAVPAGQFRLSGPFKGFANIQDGMSFGSTEIPVLQCTSGPPALAAI